MRNFILIIVFAFLMACAPAVLKKDFLTEAALSSPSKIKATPEASKGKLFILGGLIINVKNKEEGSTIEALYIATDEKGYLKEGQFGTRFIAKTKEFLDPVIYKSGRNITLIGEFTGLEKGKIGEMEYEYPVFEIKDLYLWPEEKVHPLPPPWWYDPWYYPWYDPWWRYRYPPPYWW